MSEETLSPEELVREVQELRAQAKEQEDAAALRPGRAREPAQARCAGDGRRAQVCTPEVCPRAPTGQGQSGAGTRGVAADAEDEAKALREGIQLTLRQWDNVLANAGVEEIDPLGEPFDPDLHEALSIRHDPGVTSNTVVEVAQKGYLLNQRLIRAARVIVAGGGEDPGASAT